MADDFFGTNLDFSDFDRLLKNEDLIEEPIPIEKFVTDKHYLGLPPLGDLQYEASKMITQIFKPETLIQLHGEEKGLELYKHYTVNEVICQWGKGCSTKTAKVYSPELGYKTVESLTLQPNTYKVVSHSGKAREATPFAKMGSGRAIRITTKKGFYIEVFEKHRMLGSPGSNEKSMDWLRKGVGGRKIDWCYADELSVGDVVPLKIGLPEPTIPLNVTDDEARFIGYMLGDGSLPNFNHIPRFTNATPEVQEDFKRIVIDHFGDMIRVDKSGYGCDRFSVSNTDGRNSTTLFLRSVGMEYEVERPKPWNDDFMRLSDSAAANLLNGLWATDGWINIDKSGSGVSYTICIDLTSEAVIRGVHDLLMRLGIVSKFKLQKPKRSSGKHKPVYGISISSLENCQKFLNLVGKIPGKEDVSNEILSATQIEKRSCLDENGWYWDRIASIEDLGVQDYYDCAVDEDNSYVANGFINHNSGKDHVSRVSLAYVAYLLHCLRDPLDYFGKAPGVYIDIVNLAVNAKQAQQVFFDPLKNLLLSSPWASEVGFEPRVSEIFWFSRPVRMFSGHSEAEGWEGYEVLVVVLDEISAFKIDSELKGQFRNKGAASEIYDMARASITSRFPTVGKVVLLSFPRFKGDFIQQRYKSVLDDLIAHGGVVLDETEGNKGLYREATTWAMKAATWEVNPTRHREEFENEFRRDPIMSRARFMCEPPEMVDAYFRDPETVRAAFKFKEDPMDESGQYKNWFLGSSSHSRYIHIDLGLKRDRAALCMVHSPGFKQIKTLGGVENLPIVEMDYIQSWKAEDNSEIPFASIRSAIVDLSRRFPVVSVTFDQWNCVTKDTMVFTECGIKTVDQIFDTSPDLLADSISSNKFGSIKDSGVAEVLKLTTKLGYTIETTGNHKILTSYGWKFMDQISVGDKVLIKQPCLWPSTDVVDVDEAIALGYMVSEGNFYDKRYNSLVRITSIDEDMLDINKEAMFHIADDWTYSRSVRWEETDKSNKAWEDRFYSKKGLDRLKKLGWIGGSFNEKVPWSVLASTKETQRSFLTALFDGDGCISGRITRTGNSVQVSYECRSKTLCEQIRMMLLNFGIVSSWYEYEHCGSMRYRITIGGQKAKKFMKEIGFISARKSKKAWSLVDGLADSLHKDRYDFNELGRLWISVSSIERSGEKQVYDISMPGNETFLANGIVVHNSADMIQSLRALGINADLHTVAKKDYDTLSTSIYDGRFRGYWNEILVEDELLKLKLINNSKVDHPTTGCFVGETYIPLLDGTIVPISDLVDKEVWVYSADKNGNIKPGKARGRKTKEVDLLVDVVLDSGAVIRCTPEHKFMMKDGSYKEAQSIRPGIDKIRTRFHFSKSKSISFVKLDTAVPVYDLEVDEYDNFALSAGIIVHNSKDLADSVAGANFMCISNLSSDFEIDIEILDEVNYSLMEYEEDDGIKKITSQDKKTNNKDNVPDEISDWLELI